MRESAGGFKLIRMSLRIALLALFLVACSGAGVSFSQDQQPDAPTPDTGAPPPDAFTGHPDAGAGQDSGRVADASPPPPDAVGDRSPTVDAESPETGDPGQDAGADAPGEAEAGPPPTCTSGWGYQCAAWDIRNPAATVPSEEGFTSDCAPEWLPDAGAGCMQIPGYWCCP